MQFLQISNQCKSFPMKFFFLLQGIKMAEIGPGYDPGLLRY